MQTGGNNGWETRRKLLNSAGEGGEMGIGVKKMKMEEYWK